MWPYWFVFSVASLASLASSPRTKVRRDGTRAISLDGVWLFVIAGLTLMMGFRYQVGGDWFAYLRVFETAHSLTLEQAATVGDPGYWLLNYFVAQAGGSLVIVNLLAGLTFSTGIVVFCRSLPRSWLAFAVAFPYLILVVGMGYARQGIALGFVMIALVSLGRARLVWFMSWIIIAALFHKSAVVMIALGAAAVNRNRFLWLPIIGLASFGAYLTFLSDNIDRLVNAYITAGYESQGALIRLGMNLVPAGFFLFYRKKFVISNADQRFWTLAALVSVLLFTALMVGVPSTALDRIGLYLLPLQLFVFAHLPDVIGLPGRRNTVLVAAIIAFYAAVLFVWLNFSVNARAWLPYQVWTGSTL
ncbi:EpsG family protein [Roseinatronobacter sp.]|uniref:EpsG family protein n=1 Tax=Roseinatronobacter sp. TaxID=1945755 RepID=UPI0025D74F2A|nr:EpsG family protein [Roseibaca sp.]